MKLHVTGLGEIEADYTVFRQIRNMALHSAEDCRVKAAENRKKGCQHQYEYWSDLANMYIDMLESLIEVIR